MAPGWRYCTFLLEGPSSTILWPLLLACDVSLFIRAFLLGQSSALNALTFKQGMRAARMLSKLG